jgi:hypothetical protein
MIALIRYTLATMQHSQRFLAPVLLFLVAVAISSSSDTGPIVPVYALCSGALFLSATWLTVTLINSEDPAHRAITQVNAVQSYRLLASGIVVALGYGMFMTIIGLVLPIVVGSHDVGFVELLVGFGAQLASTCTGIGVGLVCSRLVVGRPGYSLVLAIGLALVLLLVRGLPPINPMFRLLSGTRPAGELVVPVSVTLLTAVIILAVGAVITQFFAARRD